MLTVPRKVLRFVASNRKRLAFTSSLLVWTCATVMFAVGWWNSRQTGLEQEELIDSFQERNEAIAALFVSGNHGLAVVDSTGKLLEWNPFMEKLTGVPKEEMLGQTLERVMAPDAWKRHSAAFAIFFEKKDASKLTIKVNCHIKSADGRTPVVVNARIVRPKRGGPKYAIAMIDYVDRTINVN